MNREDPRRLRTARPWMRFGSQESTGPFPRKTRLCCQP